jgi:thiamine biosynthesis lipoprotein
MSVRTEVAMGTLVSIELPSIELPSIELLSTEVTRDAPSAALDRAFGWFHEIEQRCTRFNPASELMQLSAHVGEPVNASEILFEAVRFALTVAEETNGAFDPTVGHRMEARGFNREHRTGETVQTDGAFAHDTSYKDVHADPANKTITLLRPLTLDLGAVAKGLAVDMAARELAPFRHFAIDAGGDLFLSGLNSKGEPWSVGIRHPRKDRELIDCLRVSDLAVCTSGDYERRTSRTDEHHLLDPRTGLSPRSVASVTVLADGAMLADALATAAFVLGPNKGIQLLDRLGVGGLIFTSDLQRYETRGLPRAA